MYPQRPFTTNAERTWHHYKRASVVKEWREAYFYLAKEAKIPSLLTAEIIVTPYMQGKGRQQDVAACYPAAKAAIDGIVDAGVMPDDSALYLKSILFRAPIMGIANALELRVRSEIQEAQLF